MTVAEEREALLAEVAESQADVEEWSSRALTRILVRVRIAERRARQAERDAATAQQVAHRAERAQGALARLLDDERTARIEAEDELAAVRTRIRNTEQLVEELRRERRLAADRPVEVELSVEDRERIDRLIAEHRRRRDRLTAHVAMDGWYPSGAIWPASLLPFTPVHARFHPHAPVTHPRVRPVAQRPSDDARPVMRAATPSRNQRRPNPHNFKATWTNPRLSRHR